MERRTSVLQTLRRTAIRAAVALWIASALLLVGLLAPGTSEAATFNVGGDVHQIKTVIGGPCQPGQLGAGTTIGPSETISLGSPKPITLQNPVQEVGCIATQAAPQLLIIQGSGGKELFGYKSIAARTTEAITSGQINFNLAVADLPGQTDLSLSTVDGFPNVGSIYVNQEKMGYSASTATTFFINSRPSAVNHNAGSMVRLQGKLALVARGLPKFLAPYDNNEGGTNYGTELIESASGTLVQGDSVRSPKAYLTCRSLLKQVDTVVTTRERCLAILEPGYSMSDPFWPDVVPTVGVLPTSSELYPGPLQALIPTLDRYHQQSSGSINLTTGQLTLVTEDNNSRKCIPFIEGRLWIKIVTTVTVDKQGSEDENPNFGTFRITTYIDKCVTAVSSPALGLTDNLPAQSEGTNFSAAIIGPDRDSDGDGCTDAQELTDSPSGGGRRDPFNRWDYMNPLEDTPGPGQATNRIPDIVKTVNQFGLDDGVHAGYDELSDRGGGFNETPNAGWSLRPPNGSTRIPDIVAAVNSFGHDCNPV